MRALADSHVLIWWLTDDPRLSKPARRFVGTATNQIIVSSATAWELSVKNRSGKLQVQPLLDRFDDIVSEQGFESLPISSNHAVRAGALPLHHTDPFDRMLIAQAQAENLAILSADSEFDNYGIRRIW